MGNGYLYRTEPWEDIFANPKEEVVYSMDDIVSVNWGKDEYPVNPALRKINATFNDIHAQVWEDLKEHRDTILQFRKTYYQKTDRFIIVYPSGDNHRVKNVAPPRYVSIMNYNNDMFGNVGLTTMLHPPTGTWMYLHEDKPRSPAIEELISRIVKEVIPEHEQDPEIFNQKYKIESALSFKGPGCLLNRHCDHDDDNGYVRYHAILNTHDKNYMVTGNTPADDYIVAPQVGEIWGFDVSKPHWAGNDAQEEKEELLSWHLIIDVLENSRYQQGNRNIK